MILEDTDDFIRWRIPCFCDDSRHDWAFEIEWDKKVNDIVMYVYGTVYTKNSIYHRNWFVDRLRDFSIRVRIALRVLFLGYVEYEMDVGFKTSENIREHILTLTHALHRVEESGRKYGEADPSLFEKSNIRGTDRC
jgi:hypothetical protein